MKYTIVTAILLAAIGFGLLRTTDIESTGRLTILKMSHAVQEVDSDSYYRVWGSALHGNADYEVRNISVNASGLEMEGEELVVRKEGGKIYFSFRIPAFEHEGDHARIQVIFNSGEADTATAKKCTYLKPEFEGEEPSL